MKQVLFVSYYWPPSSGAGVQRGVKFVKYLPKHGIRPVVLTVDPDAATYPGRDRSLEADVPDGVRVVRTGSWEPLKMLSLGGKAGPVPQGGFAESGPSTGLGQRVLRWLRGNLLLPDARRGWVPHARKAASRIIRAGGIDTVIITSPPHSSQLLGPALKKRHPGLRVIADLRDPWTDIYYAAELHMSRPARWYNARCEARVLRGADAVVVVGEGMRSSFAAAHGPEVERKITVIPNGYDPEDLEQVSDAAPEGQLFTIRYVGTMAPSYRPEAFFKALAAVRKTFGDLMEVEFVGVVGGGVRRLAEQHGVADRCRWSPPVDHREALRRMATAHLLLLVVPAVPGSERILTGKLFEYLAVQRPILGLGPVSGDASRVLEECDAGRMFSHDDPEGIARWLVDRVGAWRNGADLRVQGRAHERYRRDREAGELAALVHALDA